MIFSNIALSFIQLLGLLKQYCQLTSRVTWSTFLLSLQLEMMNGRVQDLKAALQGKEEVRVTNFLVTHYDLMSIPL